MHFAPSSSSAARFRHLAGHHFQTGRGGNLHFGEAEKRKTPATTNQTDAREVVT